MTVVGGIRPRTQFSLPVINRMSRHGVRFQGEEAQPTEVPKAPDATPPAKKGLFQKVRDFAPLTRLGNGISRLAHLFKRDELMTTVKRIAIHTGVLTFLSGFMGPFAIPFIPIYAGAALAWETGMAFVSGLREPVRHGPPPAMDKIA